MRHQTVFSLFLFTLITMILLGSCMSYPGGTLSENNTSSRAMAPIPESGNDVQKLLIEAANKLKGADKIVVKGKKFNYDCTGVVLACYYYAGIDLSLSFPNYTGNGVSRIYHYMSDLGLLHRTDYPRPGDIIFWDNTYDRNSDGVENDTLTHMGMVVFTDEQGQISYIHHNYRKGIIFEQMNLNRSNDYLDGAVIINSPMRMKGEKRSPKWLSSHLFKQFGMGYKLDPD